MKKKIQLLYLPGFLASRFIFVFAAAFVILHSSFVITAAAAPQAVYVNPDGSIVNTTDFKFKAHKLQICDAAGANCIAVDTELDGKQDLDTDLTAIAGVSTAPFGRNALAIVDAPAFRAYIGAGTSSFSGAYSALTGIPSTFAPSAHTHPFSDITGTATAAQIPSLDAAKITTGTIATARLGTGTANSGSFLRGDQTWTAVTVPTIATTSDILKGDGAGNAIAFGSASGITTFLTTPTLVNLKTALTDETTVGWNLLTLANPGAITFLKIAADNSISTENVTNHRISLGLVPGTDIVAFNGALGTPTSGTLTNATGLPVSTGISGLGTGVATFLATPSFTNFNAMTTGDDAAGLAAANVFTGNNSNSYASTASTPAMLYSGTWLTGGTGTTNFPHFLLQATGTTASTTWSTAGTGIGVNAVTGFTGNLMDLKLAGTTKLSVTSAGNLSGGTLTGTGFITVDTGSSRVGMNYTGPARLDLPSGGVLAWASGSIGSANNSGIRILRDAPNGLSIASDAGTSTFNDASTANSGTVANRYLFGIAAPTLTATGTSVTNTVASTFYIGGAPTDSTNTTSTTKYALNVAAGLSYFAGDVKHGGNITDANNNPMFNFVSTASAVDGFTFTNAATANPATVTMAATGSDSNINIYLAPKGTGNIGFGGPNGLLGTSSSSGAISAYATTGYANERSRFDANGLTLLQDTKGVAWPAIKLQVANGALEVTNLTASQWAPMRLGTRNATNNTVTDGLTLGHQLSSGTAAAGLGEGILFNLDSSTTADQNAARTYAAWTDATHASRTSKYVIQTVNNAGALTDALTINSNGITQAAWTAPTLQNSWTNLGGINQVAGFVKDSMGWVHLRGVITGGTSTADTLLFTLDVGNRPTASEYFPTGLNNNSIYIKSNGEVRIIAASTGNVSLSGVTFSVN